MADVTVNVTSKLTTFAIDYVKLNFDGFEFSRLFVNLAMVTLRFTGILGLALMFTL